MMCERKTNQFPLSLILTIYERAVGLRAHRIWFVRHIIYGPLFFLLILVGCATPSTTGGPLFPLSQYQKEALDDS